MKRLMRWCLLSSALTALPVMASSGSASIVCKNGYPYLEVTYNTDADTGAPGLFWFAVANPDLSLGAYYDLNNTWQIYQGGLWPPNQIFENGLPPTISFEVPAPNGSHDTGAYQGWGVYGGDGVLTAQAQADVAHRESILQQNQPAMQANGTWSPNYAQAADTQKMEWAETQKDLLDNNKYALLLTIPFIDCGPPIAEPDIASLNVNTNVWINALANDSDPEGAALNIVSLGPASHGTVSFSGGRIVYTPAKNFFGTDAFTYTIANSWGLTATATDSVTVDPLPPIVVDDAESLLSNSSLSFNGTVNDSDPQATELLISAVGTPGKGTVSFNGDTITYTPALNFYGTDTFTYAVTDGAGLTSTATETITVQPRPPIAVADSASMNSNSGASFNALSNDSDPQGTALSIVSVGSASHGSVSFVGSTITYTPAVNFYGTDAFSYTIQNVPGLTAAATETMTVKARPPVAVADNASMLSNSGTSFNALSNDSDPQGAALSITGVGSAAHGSVSFNGSTITYAPAGNFYGTDTFSYTIKNSAGLTASATETMTVNARPPLAVPDSATMYSNSGASFNALSNDSDPQGLALNIVGVGSAAHGAVSYSGGTISYTPAVNFYGTDTFTYTIQNAAGLTASATETMTVNARPPVAVPDSAAMYSNSGASFNALSNDSDPQGLALNIVGVGSASHGSVNYSGANITYVPTAGFYGTDTFTYTIKSTAGLMASATETMTVNARPPVAMPDSASLNVNGSASFNALSNDSDPQGLALSITAVGSAGHGSVSYNGSTITYRPAVNWYGTDTFSYTIQNAAGLTASATETTTVNASPPVAVPDSAAMYSNSSATFNALSNDSDPQGLSLIIAGVGTASHGSVSYSGANITYTPAANWYGTDTFSYTIQNAAGLTASASETMTVNASPPIATPDSATVTAFSNVTFNALSNDSDPQGLALSIVGASSASHGTVSYNGANITYTPATNYSGTDTFTYTIKNSAGLIASATETMTVKPPLPPIAVNQTLNVYRGSPSTYTIDPTLADTDQNGMALRLQSVSQPGSGTPCCSGGSITVSGNVVTYHPSANWTGSVTVQYVITDDTGLTATANITFCLH